MKEFYARAYFGEYFAKNENYLASSRSYTEAQDNFNKTQLELENNPDNTELKNKFEAENNDHLAKTNQTMEEFLAKTRLDLEKSREMLDAAEKDLNDYNTFLWAVTNTLFVVGGMFGAFGSKFVLEFLGRKKGIVFHYSFTIIGSLLSFAATYVNSPGCIIASRLFYGLQGGLMCGLIPTYLSEIAPDELRGSCGVINQLFITVGILFAQTLGFRQLLGKSSIASILIDHFKG